MAIVSFNRQASKDEMAREIDRCHAVIEKYEAEASRSPVSQKEAEQVAECETCVGTGTIESQNEGAPDFGFTRCPTCSPSPAPAGEPVAIKALEWKDREERDEDGGTDVVGSYATALLDRSYFTSWDARHEAPWALYFTLGVVGRYETEEAAKVAAQADFEARVRSALHPSPTPVSAPVGVVEAMQPFATFAEHAVEWAGDGWVWKNSQNERICDWFGPSDFGRALHFALRSPAVEGK